MLSLSVVGGGAAGQLAAVRGGGGGDLNVRLPSLPAVNMSRL